jgi:hypothetical protein
MAPRARGSNAVEELRPALEKAFAGGGVHLIVVPIDYSENKRVLVDETSRDRSTRGIPELYRLGKGRLVFAQQARPRARCALEHGGAAPVIVDRSASLDRSSNRS